MNTNRLNNLSETCLTDNLIKEDGTAFTVFDQVKHIFNSLTGNQSGSAKMHFSTLCLRINADSFKKLGIEDQINIIMRIEEIGKTIFPDVDITKFESFKKQIKLTEEKTNLISQSLSQNLKEADETSNLRKFKHVFNTLDFLFAIGLENKDNSLIVKTKEIWTSLYMQLKQTERPQTYVEKKNEIYAAIGSSDG